MPSPERATESSAAEGQDVLEEKYLIFSILGTSYAFPSKYVGEIAVFDTVYPLPLMPEYVLGIINRYSVPYVLLDIGLLLTGEPSPQGKVLVVKDSIDRIAFLIDDIADIVDIDKAELFEVERGGDDGGAAEIISASFKRDGGDIFVLDIRLVLERVTAGTGG
jgi:purine-binding chemotaxis protein CheW